MTNIWFIAKSSLLTRNLRRFRPHRKINALEEDAQHEVQQHDDHERSDEGLGGGPADAFRARLAIETAMAGDQRNGRPEKQALENAGE